MSTRLTSLVLGGVLGLLAVPSCDLNVPDLNNPGLNELVDTPTPNKVNAAATGLLVGNRGGKSATTGLVNQLGILGRESYDFDPNDGRFINELIRGTLQKGSPFGGVFWAGNYSNILNGNDILHALDKLVVFDTAANFDAQKSAMKGFVHTIQAMEFEVIYLTHYDTGAPIDVDHPLGSPLAPFVSKDAVLKEVNRLLDLGQTELMAAGSISFTFPLSPGYAGLNKPASFLKFNRAIRAQTALYAKDYAGALTALATSFLRDTPTAATAATDLNVGAFYSYSTGAGDQINGLFNRGSVLAHPSFETDAQKQADGKTLDQRFVNKINILVDDKGMEAPVTSMNDDSLSSALTFTIYNAASSPVPVIRNEELILIKAEAQWFTGDHDGAIAELNKVRTLSGLLPPLATGPITITTDTQFIDALLYERRYSLMYEGGHRWIDLRRFNRPLPLDDPKAHKQNFRFPVPQGECDARPGEAACSIKSTDPLPAN
jgi:starch-binding outer membrane protein, SusD/RagB family